jgi:hypothetical protein
MTAATAKQTMDTETQQALDALLALPIEDQKVLMGTLLDDLIWTSQQKAEYSRFLRTIIDGTYKAGDRPSYLPEKVEG